MSTNRVLQFLSKIFSKPEKTAPSQLVDRSSDELTNVNLESTLQTEVDEDKKAIAANLKNQGNTYLEADMVALAINSYQQALNIYPDYAEVYVNLGNVSMREKDYAEAKRLLEKAITINPSIWQAHFNLGIVHEETKDIENAFLNYEKACELTQSNSECYWRLGNTLMFQKNYSEAITAYEKSLSLSPELDEIRFNKATALLSLERTDEALSELQQVLLSTENHLVHFLIGICEQMKYRYALAMHHYQKSIDFSPDHYPAHFELSMLQMMHGDYENGLAHYEKRLDWKDDKPWLIHIDQMMKLFDVRLLWKNQPLSDKTILVWSEQGLGDMIMLLRYLPILKKMAPSSKIIFYCDKSLSRVVDCMNVADKIIDNGSDLSNQQYDYHCSLMSIPYLLGTRIDNIPASPYISINSSEKEVWAARLKNYPGLKVGIVWAGNPKLGSDKVRSIKLEKLAPLINVEGVTWINLQKNLNTDEIRESGWSMINWMDECTDFYDTACLIDTLDLVISVDTSVAHMAGALGKPTWLFNRYGSEWRWFLDGDYSPWYQSIRLFRQSELGNWDGVIKSVSDELKKLVNNHS